MFACWGTDRISRLISAETSSFFGPRGLRWAPSHVAIAADVLPRAISSVLGSVVLPPGSGDLPLCWVESTTLARRNCLVAGRRVSGVQVHPWRERMRDYVGGGGRVDVYRLTEIDALSHRERFELAKLLQLFLRNGDPVQYDTAGALTSGTRVVRRFTAWRNQLDSLFCSELIAAVLQRLNRMCRRNPADFHPGRLLRSLVTQGTYRCVHRFELPSGSLW